MGRVPYRIVVSHRGRTAPLGHTRDLSLDGVFVVTKTTLPVGTVLPLSLQIGGDDEINAVGEIVRCTEDGIGLRFVRLSKPDAERLQALMAQATAGLGTRARAARLQEVGTRIVRGRDAVVALLSVALEAQVPVFLLPASRIARLEVTVSEVTPDGVLFAVGSQEEITVDDEVLAIYSLDAVSHSFSTRVAALEGGGVACVLPDSIHSSERRSSGREAVHSGTVLSLPLPWSPGERRQFALLDRSPRGLSFRVPAATCGFLPGTPIDHLDILHPDGTEEHIRGAEVRNLGVIDPGADEVQLRVGVALGPARRRVDEISAPALPSQKASPWWERLRWWFARRVADSRGTSVQTSGSSDAFDVVRIAAGQGELIGLLDLSVPNPAKARCPLLIVLPDLGLRKETASPLAVTVLEHFKANNGEIAVLRLDGSNNLGESWKDPSCQGVGRETLHYTLGGVVDDLRAALEWARTNDRLQPSDIVVFSSGLSSVAVRHALTVPEAGDVSLWISAMGAADADDAILRYTGHLDLGTAREHGVGPMSIAGFLVEGDRFLGDLQALDIGSLDRARSEMAKLRCDVAWLLGKHDRWASPRLVRELMTVAAAGEREIVEVDVGHAAWDRDDAALQVYTWAAERVWREVRGTWVRAEVPSRVLLDRTSAAEWARVGGHDPVKDRVSWWRSYLLGRSGSVDLLAWSPSYMAFAARQTKWADVSGQRLIEVGSGNGNLTSALLRAGPASMVYSDLVPDVLEMLRDRLTPGDTEARGVVLDADGSPWVAMRRWLCGDLGTVVDLARRIPGVPVASMRRVADRYGPALHAALRGAAIDAAAVARAADLDGDAVLLVHDLNAFARVVLGRLAPEAVSFSRLSPALLDANRGLPFDDDSFDRFVMGLTLSYLSHPRDALWEARRVLVPGGKVLVSSMRRGADLTHLFDELVGHLERASLDELPEGATRDELITSARVMLQSDNGLVRLVQEGRFRFYGADELEAVVCSAGFEDVEVHGGFGKPHQAVVAIGTVPQPP